MSANDPFQGAGGMRVVRGTPNDAELAALVAGVVAMASANTDVEDIAAPTSAWMNRSRSFSGRPDRVLGRGPNAWRTSLR